MLVPFSTLFPEIASDEIRYVLWVPPGYGASTPVEELIDKAEHMCGFHEHYCVDPNCDCRMVLVKVIPANAPIVLATIGHLFEPPKPGHHMQEQTYLDPILQQSPQSEMLLDIFKTTVRDKEYAQRLQRHYKMVREVVADKTHPLHSRLNSGKPAKDAFPWADTGRTQSRGKNPFPSVPPRRGRRRWA